MPRHKEARSHKRSSSPDNYLLFYLFILLQTFQPTTKRKNSRIRTTMVGFDKCLNCTKRGEPCEPSKALRGDPKKCERCRLRKVVCRYAEGGFQRGTPANPIELEVSDDGFEEWSGIVEEDASRPTGPTSGMEGPKKSGCEGEMPARTRRLKEWGRSPR